MSEFNIGDRVITTTGHPFPGPGLAGRVVGLWGAARYPRVRLELHWRPRGTSWSMYDNELALAPSRVAAV